VGIVNGFIVAWMRIPPFITTLATLYMVRGIALRMINDASSINLNQKSDFTTIAGTTVGNGIPNFIPLPFPIPLMIVAFIIGILVLRYTRFGRYVLAIGGNPEAAQLMGLPVKRTLFTVYTISGALSGLVGVLLAINLNGGSAVEGNGWELIAIAAVVVGGTLLTGGVGSVFGTFVGVLLLGMIVEILQLENNYTLDHGGGLYLNSFWQDIIRGIFLLVVVLLQSRLQRQRAKQST
jgi:ribose transport system permease protein